MLVGGIRWKLWSWRVRRELGNGRGNIDWSWSRREFSGQNIGVGNVGWNRETSIVVGGTSPEIIQPLRNVGGCNEIIEGACREMIDPGKPRRLRFWRE